MQILGLTAKTMSRTLAEFVLIVLGVTVALAADSWRETLLERRLEESIINRLVDDFELQLEEFEEARREVTWAMAHGKAVLPYIDGNGNTENPISVLVSAYQASRWHTTIELVDHTYVEIFSTGGLGLIASPEIRAAVVNFYRRYEFGRPADLRKRHNEAYYNLVRARIPFEIQQQIRFAMRDSGTNGCALEDEPLQCKLEADTDIVAEAFSDLADPEIAYSLNLWMQSLVNEVGMTDTFGDLASDVLRVIAENR